MFMILYLVWGIILAALYVFSISTTIHYNREIVKEASRAFFLEIVTTRSWNASHGGVYLMVNEHVQPNPYLKDSLRDLTTTNGLSLTKVNPAYMTRQISEIARTKEGILSHITSLNPIRPANKPDDWERKALGNFEQGAQEQFEMIEKDSSNMFRYMAPLLVEPSCLDCHAKQGYTLGQIQGGISITTQSEGFFTAIQQQIITRSVIFFVLFSLGFIGIFFFQRIVNRQFRIIQNQNNELIRGNLEKDRLFSIMAHDLRAPLSGIHGLSNILSEEHDSLSQDEQMKITRSIYKSADAMIKLTEDLILWYSNRKGTLQYTPELFHVHALVDEVLDVFIEKMDQKEISVTVDIPAGLAVYADINMAETMLRNLVNNALKFTPRGGSVEIRATDAKQPDFIELSVKDSGIGMDQETADHLFDQDFNPSRSGTENEKGTGLGLAICRDFVKKNEGQIQVISTPGVGSRFILTLPKKAPA